MTYEQESLEQRQRRVASVPAEPSHSVSVDSPGFESWLRDLDFLLSGSGLHEELRIPGLRLEILGRRLPDPEKGLSCTRSQP